MIWITRSSFVPSSAPIASLSSFFWSKDKTSSSGMTVVLRLIAFFLGGGGGGGGARSFFGLDVEGSGAEIEGSRSTGGALRFFGGGGGAGAIFGFFTTDGVPCISSIWA